MRPSAGRSAALLHAAPPASARRVAQPEAPAPRARRAHAARLSAKLRVVCAHGTPIGAFAAAASATLEAPAAPGATAPSATGAPSASGASSQTHTRFEVAIPRGETGGADLLVDGVSIQAGDRDLLDAVDWRVLPGMRVGLVGANGCGKTTLLKALCGLRPVDGGRLLLSPTVTVGYLEQVGVSGSSRSVWEEAKSRMTHVLDAEAALDAALKDVEAGVPRAAEALQEAQAAFEAVGGYDADKRIANVLAGLGFKQAELHKSASEFSGGWQMRIGLARTLLSPAGESSRGGGGGLLLLVRCCAAVSPLLARHARSSLRVAPVFI
jgi:ABC-type branched-subunit amino acid transport system ATPase component